MATTDEAQPAEVPMERRGPKITLIGDRASIGAALAKHAADTDELDRLLGVDSLELAERHDPELVRFGNLTTEDVLAQARRGLRGRAVLEAALAARVRAALAQRKPTVPMSASRSREHRPQSNARRSARFGTSTRASSADDGSSGLAGEPRPRSCEGCGRLFTPTRPNRTHCSSTCRMRAYRARIAEPGLDGDLLEAAECAYDAVRAGCEPYLTLSILVWPPETADEARRLLAAAAPCGLAEAA
jgi:hypothetical protein